MWLWVKIKPPGYGLQVLVHVSIYPGNPFWVPLTHAKVRTKAANHGTFQALTNCKLMGFRLRQVSGERNHGEINAMTSLRPVDYGCSY